jgi:two-component sensor histidine kinase
VSSNSASLSAGSSSDPSTARALRLFRSRAASIALSRSMACSDNIITSSSSSSSQGKKAVQINVK